MRPAENGELSFRGVTVRFPDGTTAVDGFDLVVAPGEFVSVVGPSGCGKSTLLRVAAGLQKESSGDTSVDRSSIGFVFQDATLLPWKDVRGNVELPCRLHRLPHSAVAARVDRAIATVGLVEFANHLPRQLSGGMKMRVSLARALTMEPAVFLFDEPFGALDEMTRERLNDEILELHRASRFTGLFVTHSITEAVYMSDRVVVMSPRPGRVIADIRVDLPADRGHDVRYTAEFGAISAQVSHALRKGSA